MIFKKNIFLLIFLCLIAINNTSFSQEKITQTLAKLYQEKKINELELYTKEKLQNFTIKSTKDSLLYSKLLYYKYKTQKNAKDYNVVNSLKKIIKYCPNNNSGDSLKASTFNIKAYYESGNNSTTKSHQSILKSLSLLQNIPNANAATKMGAYLLLSSNYAFFGNKKKALNAISSAEEIYLKNKEYIDNNTWLLNGNNHRMIVITKYRKMYLLYKLGDTTNKKEIVKTMQELEELHSKPSFHKEEQAYYSTALSHIGDWFISQKHDSLTSKTDVKKGLKYLLKAQYLIENKGYSGTPWAIKYNLAKGYIRNNQLEKADEIMFNLTEKISKTDGRLPFFLAQKAQIKAKRKQRDSALYLFKKAIEKIHSGKEKLKKDMTNFNPSTYYNHTKLLLRIAEELEYHFKKDSIALKTAGKLYNLALQQLQNSYLKSSFNNLQNNQLKQIIHGILKYKNTGYFNEKYNEKELLNTYETIKGKLAWKKFYENRFTSSLPELDSINKINLSLASKLAKAKIEKNDVLQDSITYRIEKLKNYQQKLYPQLELLSNFSFSINELQHKLQENELVLKYIVENKKLAVYCISRDTLISSLNSFDPIKEEKIRTFIRDIELNKFYGKNASEIAKIVLPKIDAKYTHLIINPDDILFKLPFETLFVDNSYLITEKYNISYTSNLGFLYRNNITISKKANVHIYAPNYSESGSEDNVRGTISNLKGASKEAKTISSLFPSKLYNSSTIKKETFLETAANAKILHLAMHAEVDEDYPEFSRLLLSNDVNSHEKQLYLEELYNAKLGADLAILSACNTGSGKEENGVIASFQRAFMFAGVPSTVASLWEVPDISTQEIMIDFYKNLKKGQTKSKALRNAKLKYKSKYKGSKLANPYFWAGFVIYGTDSSIQTSSYFIYYIILIVSILLGAILYVKKKIKF